MFALPTARQTGAFQWFDRVDDAFDSMLKAIGQAQHSVCLEMYIFEEAGVGERFKAALKRAAERKVKVRVLIDALGSLTMSGSFWEPLTRAGGEFRWFNPLRLQRLAIRNHRKLLICDNQIAFVGGFNISADYEGDGVTHGWYDLGLKLSGPLVKALAESFDGSWDLADFQHQRFIRLRKNRHSNLVPTTEGQLLLMAPGRGRSELKQTLVEDLNNAGSIKIISAYFIPTRPIRRALNEVARRGGSVQLIMAGKSDIPISQLATRRFYHGFLRAGIEIHEYEPQILHAKLLIIDDIVYVGSANLDRRSLFINYELMLRLTNPTLAMEAEAIFSRALARSRRVELEVWRRSRGFWARLKEEWAFWLLARVDPYVAHRQLRRLQALR